jgi:hypothetical protein
MIVDVRDVMRRNRSRASPVVRRVAVVTDPRYIHENGSDANTRKF